MAANMISLPSPLSDHPGLEDLRVRCPTPAGIYNHKPEEFTRTPVLSLELAQERIYQAVMAGKSSPWRQVITPFEVIEIDGQKHP